MREKIIFFHRPNTKGFGVYPLHPNRASFQMAKAPAGRGTSSSFKLSKTPPKEATSKQATPEQLSAITNGLKKVRDLRAEIDTSNEIIKEKNETIHTLERKTLPELFTAAGVKALTLEKDGNYPAYEAERSAYYRANIAVGWEAEKRQKAFDWLEKNGGADLIRCEIVVSVPRTDVKKRKAVIDALKKLKVEHDIQLNVPWASLTSFIKEMYERKKKSVPLELLGADVGEIVKMKRVKEK